MLKPTVKRGLMLDFIPNEIICAEKVDKRRIFKIDNLEINDGGIVIPPYDSKFFDGDIVYLSTRELRLEDNWAVVFGLELAKKHNKKFKIIVILSEIIHSKMQEAFLLDGIKEFKQNCLKNEVGFEILTELPQNMGALIVDFNPICLHPHPQPLPPQVGGEKHIQSFYGSIFEVDSHNVIPARHISDKQEYSAATLRRKVYANIADFLTEYPDNLQSRLGFPAQQHKLLNDFINTKLDNYAEFKNIPQKEVTSGLSPYLTFGFISSQRVALEVVKSGASRPNIEAFLEELITRKELADNFCLYAKSYKTFESIPQWAIDTLNEHRKDIRTYLYSIDEFEQAKTHDELWNKIQKGLLKSGKIHGYLRMYWAKKILEWSISPNEALKIAIFLNDEYALDGNNPNGYVGILWAIGALHDRAFTNRFVTGKIRYMKGSKIEF